jgi:hypothetical protein
VGKPAVAASGASMPVLAVGSSAPEERRRTDLVVQEATDDAPAIVVEVDDD